MLATVFRGRRVLAALLVMIGLFATNSYAVVAEGNDRPQIIYQAFNEPFTRIKDKLEKIQDLGYTHILVSPPQKSIDETIWWGRYQPVDFRKIEGPLGNERQFKEMIDAARSRGLIIMVDVVLNHMADPVFYPPALQYPQFSARDFHYVENRPCITDWNNRYQVTKYWLCDPAYPDRGLPDLNTSSEYVRSVHREYFKKLSDLGVEGFRLDAAKHIEASYFADLIPRLNPRHLTFGEVIGTSWDEYNEYLPYMRLTDFQLLSTMIGAFSFNGQMRDLTAPEQVGAALQGHQAIVFARNHDTAMHDGFFNFSDVRDAHLATAYILARGIGIPFVYRDDYDADVVRTALRFHHRQFGRSSTGIPASEVCSGNTGICNDQTALFIRRGDRAVAMINKAAQWLDASAARIPGLKEGCYRELNHGTRMEVRRGGDGQNWVSNWGNANRGGVKIGPRDMLFFVADRCN